MTEIHGVVVKTRALLVLRGYQVKELFEYESRFAMYPRKNDNGTDIKLVVWVFKEPKVIGVAFVKDLVKEMEEKDAQEGMLVGGSRFTPAAKKHARMTRVELVKGNYASFDLFKHEVVPTHTIAKNEEIELVLKYYKILKPQLPRILRNDPAVKVLGAKAGQVIRIKRESQTAGTSYYYRLVVDPGQDI
jgi:DNA-directed RNA polymerase subunit H (RpoH/RPB5)